MLWMVLGSLLVQTWLITLKSFFTPWFCQSFRVYFNKSVCFHRKFIKLINLEAFIKETIIWHCYLDGDLSHTTDIAYFSFPMTSNWPNPQDLSFLLICQHLKMIIQKMGMIIFIVIGLWNLWVHGGLLMVTI